MATLRANGTVLLKIEKLDHAVAYMSNGYVLRNNGHGWKRWKKVCDGVSPEDLARNARAKWAARVAARPAYVALLNAFHAEFPRDRRGIVLTAFELLSDDVDGLWSELNDSLAHSISVEDVAHLAKLFLAAIAETNRLKTSN